MSQIKINQANKLAPKLPMADAEIWESIPQSLIDELTGKQLAEVKKALNHHWHKAAKHTEARIIGDGYVWSDAHQALLDIQYPKAVSNG